MILFYFTNNYLPCTLDHKFHFQRLQLIQIFQRDPKMVSTVKVAIKIYCQVHFRMWFIWENFLKTDMIYDFYFIFFFNIMVYFYWRWRFKNIVTGVLQMPKIRMELMFVILSVSKKSESSLFFFFCNNVKRRICLILS